MDAVRKKISFLIIGVLLAFFMALFCRPLAADCLSILKNGWGERRYLAAAAGGDRVCLVSQADDAFRLTLGTLDGARTGERTVQLPVSAKACTVAGLYPASDGSVLLGVYEPDDTDWKNLALYRVPAEGEAERLLLYPCDPGQGLEQLPAFSSFGEQGGVIRFATLDGRDIQPYAVDPADGGLQEEQAVRGDAPLAAAVLADGTVIASGFGELWLDGHPAAFSVEDAVITQLTQSGAGLLYLDSAGLSVFYSDLTGSNRAEVLDLSSLAGQDHLTSLALVDDGSVLTLRSGRTLERLSSDGTTDLTGLLYRAPALCVLLLVLLALLWLLLTAAAWYLLCGRRRSQVPLALRTGGVLAVCALVAGTAVSGLVVQPAVREENARAAEQTLAGMGVLALLGDGPAVETRGDVASVVTYEMQDDVWRVTGGSQAAGSQAALTPGFSSALADRALTQGQAFAQQDGVFQLYLEDDGEIMQMTAAGSAPDSQSSALTRAVWAGLALLWACAMLAMLLVGRRVRVVTEGMERLASGDTAAQVTMRTGDELEGLATSFNSMARAMRRQEDDKDSLIRAYLRFVPERVLALLGRDSVLEVDKHTFATRRMSAMMVWFAFPDRVYDHSTRALFDSINEVVERTAAIVARKGGTVFNFTHDGYDVVLGGSEEDAVSTAVAVQQEVLSLNEQREIAGRPPVTLRIALDIGEVMIGVVGDETQMEPATISSSFTATRRLIELAGRLEAGILCTENVIAGAKGYGSRYMGKCYPGSTPVRVYEIYDGDPFGMRRGKENGVRRFSQGVFALYSRDFATAKRIFLELVHESPDDGGARYYLYLADQMEKRPEQKISLEYEVL